MAKEYIVKVLNYKDVIDGIRVIENDISVPSNYQEVGELIRCKDCRYCDDSGKSNALKCTNWYIDVDPHPDFYCGYGMRKEE